MIGCWVCKSQDLCHIFISFIPEVMISLSLYVWSCSIVFECLLVQRTASVLFCRIEPRSAYQYHGLANLWWKVMLIINMENQSRSEAYWPFMETISYTLLLVICLKQSCKLPHSIQLATQNNWDVCKRSYYSSFFQSSSWKLVSERSATADNTLICARIFWITTSC